MTQMTAAPATGTPEPDDLLAEVLGDAPPAAYALLARDGSEVLEVLVGDVVDVDTLAQIPLDGPDGPQQVLALVPFRQVAERGYACHDDGAPLRCLVVRRTQQLEVTAACRRLPQGLPTIADEGFDVSDEEYTQTVRSVIQDEIGRGEGANFVIRRDYLARTESPAQVLAPAVLRELLETETGAYWSFAVVTPEVALVGASPERHVSVKRGAATMNPISGTFRHPATGLDPSEFSAFLMDTKEVEELFMVVDEELKMMSEVCRTGGFVRGPFLKQMSRVTHTEYLLSGHTDLDVRDVLRETMFAPTVTGSPMQNACAVIARHETSGRGYYSGVLALMTPEPDGGVSLDAPILIRTAQIESGGRIRVCAGATLVRHSTPEGEVAETYGKASGLLVALGLVPPAPASASGGAAPVLSEDGSIQRALRARNDMLAPFWLAPQLPAPVAGLDGRRAVVVDAEDRFTTMLAHLLRHLGMMVSVVRWTDVAADGTLGGDHADADLVVAGPGPGDPREGASGERVDAVRRLVRARLDASLPLLAVCLSHQVLADVIGVPLVLLDQPRQGLQMTGDLFGTSVTIGYYNTFTARASSGVQASLPSGVELAADPVSGDVFAMRGPGFGSLQGHAESVLSVDGLLALEVLARHALTSAG